MGHEACNVTGEMFSFLFSMSLMSHYEYRIVSLDLGKVLDTVDDAFSGDAIHEQR